MTALSVDRPFPGLRPFGQADGPFFFGRQQQSFALYRLIERGCFVAVVGGSGSGKSSLVRAGLRPLLDEENAEKGGNAWLCGEMRPGSDPLAALADVLSTLVAESSPQIASVRRERIALQLRQSSFGIEAALSEIQGLGEASILLIVDQFEELFRYASAGTKADRREQMRLREDATLFVQLLLEIGRRRTGKVHILLTMRSDFIGDCLRFQGLPEAVSASQFLVPALTRDQLEQVIRGPIREAGAAIEPGLIERILNDCTEDPDNLPVLQHCLLRLWERAGTSSVPAAAPGGEPKPRVITEAHYREIGGMAEALSRHADEILTQMKVPQNSVEQVMRALAEVDREGRAVRRALSFAQLEAEAGIPRQQLDEILDRFRADDCSFLVPPLSATPHLLPTTTVDVGHEALLRRWKKVSGDEIVSALTRSEAAESEGWLRAEESDGQRYRALITMLDKRGHEGGILPLHRVAEFRDWWRERPRTEAWAERYGGRFDRVRSALADGEAALARDKRQKGLNVAIKAALIFVVVVGSFVLYLLKQQRDSSRRTFKTSVQASQSFLDGILTANSNGDLTVKGARSLAEIAKANVDRYIHLRANASSTALLVKLRIVEIDLAMKLGESSNALALGQDTKLIIEPFLEGDNHHLFWLQFMFAISLRIGDAQAGVKHDAIHLTAARAEYLYALQIATEASQLDQADTALLKNIVQAYQKLGDIGLIEKNFAEALSFFKKTTEIFDKNASVVARDEDWQRLLANSEFRVSGVFQSCNLWKQAYQGIINARTKQETLINSKKGNTYITSNLIATHTRVGRMLIERHMLRKSLEEYTIGMNMLEKLEQNDPTNPQWQVLLAMAYENVADLLQTLGKTKQATAAYRQAYNRRKILLERDPNNKSRQDVVAQKAEKLADNLIDPDDQVEREQLYREAIMLSERLADRNAETNGKRPKRAYERFADHTKLAKILAVRGDIPGAGHERLLARSVAEAFRKSGGDDSKWATLLARDLLGAKRRILPGGGFRRLMHKIKVPESCKAVKL